MAPKDKNCKMSDLNAVPTGKSLAISSTTTIITKPQPLIFEAEN
jgi:hypothetical protein